MRYTTIRCPYCKKFIQIMKPNNWSYSDYLGEPIAYCNFCSKPYKTGRKKWDKMTDKEKKKLHLYTYLHALVGAFWVTLFLVIILMVVVFAIFKLSDEFFNKYFKEYIGYISLSIFILMYYVSVRLEKQTLSEKILES